MISITILFFFVLLIIVFQSDYYIKTSDYDFHLLAYLFIYLFVYLFIYSFILAFREVKKSILTAFVIF